VNDAGTPSGYPQLPQKWDWGVTAKPHRVHHIVVTASP
jgi:hypothetical protein